MVATFCFGDVKVIEHVRVRGVLGRAWVSMTCGCVVWVCCSPVIAKGKRFVDRVISVIDWVWVSMICGCVVWVSCSPVIAKAKRLLTG